MQDIMPQSRGNLTGFPELYSNGHLILNFFFSLHYQLFETNQNTEETLSILMGLKGGDCNRKAEVKIEQCECQFEYFILHLKSRLLKKNNRLILME